MQNRRTHLDRRWTAGRFLALAAVLFFALVPALPASAGSSGLFAHSSSGSFAVARVRYAVLPDGTLSVICSKDHGPSDHTPHGVHCPLCVVNAGFDLPIQPVFAKPACAADILVFPGAYGLSELLFRREDARPRAPPTSA